MHARGQLGGRARGDDPAVDQDRDPVREPLDVGEVVAREEDRDAGRPQLGDDPAGRGAALRVHPGGRLVEQQDLGTPDERQREAEPLPLAAGQAPVAGVGRVPEPDEVQQLVGVARVRVERRVLAEGLARPRPHVDAAALEHQPDPGSQLAPAGRGVQPQHPGGPGVRPAVPLDDLDGRRLARAVRPEERHDLAGPDLERDAVDHRSIAVPLDQAIELDGGRHGAIRAYWRSKSASVSSPIWIDRITPVPSTK